MWVGGRTEATAMSPDRYTSTPLTSSGKNSAGVVARAARSSEVSTCFFSHSQRMVTQRDSPYSAATTGWTAANKP